MPRMSHAEILRRLKGLKGQYPKIARETGVDYNYIIKITNNAFRSGRRTAGQAHYDALRQHPLIKHFKRHHKNV
jgi:hypothetical protein